jgi:hypothetical protein
VFCRFHPWQESGEANRGWITVQRTGGGAKRIPAQVVGSQLVASVDLGPGDRVNVAAGDVLDEHGNTNGSPSPVATKS